MTENISKKDPLKIQNSISFVLPMYNEREAIEDTIEEMEAIAEALTSDYEIIISDDGSTDGSGEIADNLAKRDSRIKVIHLKENTMFGGALSAGLKETNKDIIIYTDSDLPVSLLDMKKSLLLLEDADIVTASSIVKKGENLKRKIVSLVYNFLIETLFRTHIKDINSGYKIFKKHVIEGIELKSKSPFVDVEIFVNAMRKGAKIKEYPLIFRTRRQGKSKISRIPVIIQTFIDMLRFKFGI